jgi:hypothetical protein
VKVPLQADVLGSNPIVYFRYSTARESNKEVACHEGRAFLVHLGCVKTVSEPLRLDPMEIGFERIADSPSYCFLEEVVSTRRAFRPGSYAPKAGALGPDG